jgi:DNA polymerase III delta prime subunit
MTSIYILNIALMNCYMSVPWVEKYRPNSFEDIVLSPLNRRILNNIVETSNFPNVLFYGPPGTGKTTTVINLIARYQDKHGQKNRSLVIHLNASDERGIEVIRSQINQFVASKPLFASGTKFVILDEVDYMTKNAQQALRYLLQSHDASVRFCLICNYVSKIDEALQADLVRLRFNQLPSEEVRTFIDRISKIEQVNLSPDSIKAVQRAYGSDMRSMINYIQSNMGAGDTLKVADDAVWEAISPNKDLIDTNTPTSLESNLRTIMTDYALDMRSVLSGFVYYLVRQKSFLVTQSTLHRLARVMHLPDPLPDFAMPLFCRSIVPNM